jgi:thymidylate kinase
VIDRLEREHDEFFSGVAEAYRQLAAREPGRIRSLDASESPERVLGAALAELSDLFLPEARERHR